jgi:NAD(P)-dependent dehydrogenase (short-subunit alcohol dehydrogenase family)
VAITGQNAQTLASARATLGPEALVLASDASSAAQQAALAAQLEVAFGARDVAVVNAGVADFRPLQDFDEAAFERVMTTNFKGPFFLLQALLPLLARPSSVVLNGSVNAHIGMPNASLYAASKAALLSLARTLSDEWLGRNIRVNAISPGPVATPIFGKLGLSAGQAHGLAQHVRSQVPLGRFGLPEDIARAALFLASDDSAFCLGSELVADGGMSTL